MGSKAGKWQQHLKAAEASGVTLVAYAVQHRINVRRLYEARRARVQAAARGPGKHRPRAFARVKVVTPTAPNPPNPTRAKLAMQARLGNGVILSWSLDGDNTQALGTVLHSLAVLTICALYKSRWQVELFSKWIKRHLRIKKFLGTSEERGQDAGVVRRSHLRVDRHRQKGAST